MIKKAISALRDDVEILLKKLFVLYNNKHEFLKKVFSREIDKRYCLKSGDLIGLLESLEQDNEIYDRVSVLDFDIETVKNEICRISGISGQHFHNNILNKKEKLCIELKILLEKIQEELAELTVERDKLISEMEKRQSEIEFDIKSLSNIKRLKI